MGDEISVRGGSNGIEAHCEQMVTLARRFGGAALDTAEQALAGHGYLIHPAVLASAVLDPVGAADFSAELIAGLDGPSGLTWRAAEFGLLDLGLRGAAVAYQQADDLRVQIQPWVEAELNLTPALLSAGGYLIRGDVDGAGSAFVASNPELVDVLGVLLTDPRSPVGGRLVVATSLDGRPEVSRLPADPAMPPAPRAVTELIAGVDHRSGTGGDIDVRFIVGPDGQRRVIVDIPGTDSWNPVRGANPADVSTNVPAINGRPTTYQEGVLEAMRRAGVTATDDVLMVGHSLGGMIAVNAAAQAARSGEFNVSHVVTAGSPIARLDVPDSVQVLAIENRADLVPHADGSENRDRTNITTVTVDHDHGSIGDNHSMTASYIPGAADIDASDDPSITDYRNGLQPFLTGTQVSAEVLQIQRV